jgi:hypothetical protein
MAKPWWGNNNMFIDQSPFSDEGLSYVYRSAMLPDGRVVVSGYDGNGPVLVLCYEKRSTTVVDWSHTIVGSLFSSYSDVCVLTNGNIVVMYIDYDVPERAHFVILDSDGGLVQGPTNCDPDLNYDANYDVPNHVLAMVDGGFYCYWIEDSTYPAGSVWNGDGTQRVPYSYYWSDIEPSAPVQMPTGGGGTYAGWFVVSVSSGHNGLFMIDPADNYDQNYPEWEVEWETIQGNPLWIYMAVIPSWTDRIAILWEEGASTYYMILKDDGTTVSGRELLNASVAVSDLIVLPDETLLMIYTDGATEYGQSYYILDTSDNTELSILSGPHTAFTGLTSNRDPACHGCADAVASVSLSSSSTSSSSSSTSSTSSSSNSSSSTSSSSVSSSSSTANGALTSIDVDNQSDYPTTFDLYHGVWTDANFIYVACYEGGLRTFSADGAGALTFIDQHIQGALSSNNRYYGVWGDGNFVYVACKGNGLRSYSVDGGGNLTYIDVDDQGGNHYGVWGDGNFIYAACGLDGIRSYSVDGGGNLTYIDTDDQGGIGENYNNVWGDGNFIYVTCERDGLRSYSVDGGGNLTHIDVDYQSSNGDYHDVWGDGNFIYVVTEVALISYSVDGSGNLTFIDNHARTGGGKYQFVWGDGNFVYVGAEGDGLRSYSVDGSGNLTFIDDDDQGGGYNGVWGDGTFIYVGCSDSGLRSYSVKV